MAEQRNKILLATLARIVEKQSLQLQEEDARDIASLVDEVTPTVGEPIPDAHSSTWLCTCIDEEIAELEEPLSSDNVEWDYMQFHVKYYF